MRKPLMCNNLKARLGCWTSLDPAFSRHYWLPNCQRTTEIAARDPPRPASHQLSLPHFEWAVKPPHGPQTQLRAPSEHSKIAPPPSVSTLKSE